MTKPGFVINPRGQEVGIARYNWERIKGAEGKGPLAKPQRPTTKNQFIGFFGSLVNGRGAEETQRVEVLAGHGAPTVTGGWPEWISVPRPQRVSFTVLQGYPPITLTIPILFEAVLETEGRMDVEREIQKLEWMAGRGRPLGSHPKAGGVWKGAPGHDALGDSPLINVFTTDSSGKETPLIPVQFQSLDYVMTDIAFDTATSANSINTMLVGPLRDRGGARVRQAATVTLLQHVGAPGTSFDSPSTRAQDRQNIAKKGEYHASTSTLNTLKKMVGKYASHNASGALKEVQAASQNKRLPRNAEATLKNGTRVFFPYQATRR